MEGINFSSIPSANNCLFTNTIIPADLTGNIDSTTNLDIFSNLKGEALEPENIFVKLDFSYFVLFIYTLLALLFGYESWQYKEYLKLLGSRRSFVKVFIMIMLTRFLLFCAAFLLSAGIVLVWVLARGIIFTAADYIALAGYFLYTLGMLLGFFFIGGILGTVHNKKLSFALIFPAWFFLVFLLSGLVFSLNNEAKPGITRHYQTMLKKFDTIIDFEREAEEKFGKFNPKNLESARKVIEYYWMEIYPRIESEELRLLADLARYIEGIKRVSALNPVNYYLLTCNEASSRGYDNYLRFYRYLVAMQRKFVRFWLDQVYYSETKKLVPFIQAEENVFQGQSALPSNYRTGTAICYLYGFILAFFNYLGFLRWLLYLNDDELKSLEHVRVSLLKSQLVIYTIKGDILDRLLHRVLSGKIKGLQEKDVDIEILSGDIDISKEKNKIPFLYVCHPDHLPGDQKVRDLLLFHARCTGKSRAERQGILNDGEIAPLIDREVSDLEIHEKFTVLMALVKMYQTSVSLYQFYDVCRGLPVEYALKFKSLMEELISGGAVVLFLTSPVKRTPALKNHRGFMKSNSWLYNVESNRALLIYDDGDNEIT